MARAIANTRTEEIEVKHTEERVVVDGVHLTLDQDEAQTLYDAIYYVFGGNPGKSRRRHLEQISIALHKVGYEASFGCGVGMQVTDMRPKYDAIWFEDQEGTE